MSRRVLAAAVLAASLSAAPARALDAAAGKVDITPDLKTERVWMAGFGSKGRRPRGVHDPLYARLLLLREGKTTVAVVGLDLLGYYRKDTEDLRRLAGFTGDGRFLLVHATHQHSGPDTLGLWGPAFGISGLERRHHARVKRAVADALKLLETQLRPATLAGARSTLDPRGLCRDSRDPQVIDPNLAVLKVNAKDGRAIATVVNWSCHPEVLGRDNFLITADYPGPLCERVEKKTGGACLFLNGAIGGLMTPDNSADNFYESYRIGTAVADAALALKPAATGTALAYRSELVRVPVENSRYLLVLPALIAGHDLLSSSGQVLGRWQAWALAIRHLLFKLKPEARPWVETEVSVLDAGPARLLGMPAEIFPELAIGGYDGRYAFGRPVVDPKGVARDLSAAPKGPYLRDLINAPTPMLVGLANDELGYVMPEYDFQVRPGRLMLPRLPGHYEETNSIGPSATKILTDAAARLLGGTR